MIKTEPFDATHIRTFSDRDMMIRSAEIGVEFVDAVDPISEKRKYLETATPIHIQNNEIAPA